MEVIGVIPARYESKRFPGKLLADLGGKPVIRHVYERSAGAKGLKVLLVATDDKRIFDVVESFGGKAVMTSPRHKSGTDRIAEVMAKIKGDVVVNIQGDEPFIRPKMIEDVIKPFKGKENVCMATLKCPIEKEEEITDPNVVKVVTDSDDFALYFSRLPVPYVRDGGKNSVRFYKHIGLYAYTRGFLLKFAKLPHSSLEQAERLEQLRALEYGYSIKVLETRYSTLGIDTRQDLALARKMLRGENA